jgi:hypothetical protein
MGVNEGNCISCYLCNIIKGEPCCFLLTPCLPFVNTHAAYRIGSNTAGLDITPSFDEVYLFSSLGQGKHLASSLSRIWFCNNYFMP